MFGHTQDLTGNVNQDLVNLYDQYIALRRELNDMLYNLDSDNVREINAERVNVINLNADNVVTGTLTGITIRTGESGARIELNENGIISYNSSGQLHGLVFDPANVYAEFSLYYNNVEYFNIERLSGGLYIAAFGNNMLSFNNSTLLTIPRGEWDFSSLAGLYGISSWVDWSHPNNPFAYSDPSDFKAYFSDSKFCRNMDTASPLRFQVYDDGLEVFIGTDYQFTLYP